MASQQGGTVKEASRSIQAKTIRRRKKKEKKY
jgi:hypothetical protein